MDAHNRDDGEEQLLDMIRGGDRDEEDFSSQFLNDSGEGAEEEARTDDGVDRELDFVSNTGAVYIYILRLCCLRDALID